MGFAHFKHMMNVDHCYHWYVHPGHYVSRPNASFLLKCYDVQEIMYVDTEELIREVKVGYRWMKCRCKEVIISIDLPVRPSPVDYCVTYNIPGPAFVIESDDNNNDDHISSPVKK